MTGADLRYDGHRGAVLLEASDEAGRWRVTVPRDLLEDEIGSGATEFERVDWVRHNLPRILSALTARREGGYVDPPWGRLMVEEAG